MEAMTEWLKQFSPVWQAIFATLFTWGVTALGASVIFLFKKVNRKLMDGMMGFAAGVMLAASFWSLLAPAIEMAEEAGQTPWVPAVTGFLLGAFFLAGIDKLIPHLHIGLPESEAEGISTNWHRSILLVLAITLHNIPEGLAVGVSFGAAATDTFANATFGGAVALAIGIGLQNFPEGLAVSAPLRREGFSRKKAFFYGQLSGAVEPIGAAIGAAAVMAARPILPYSLSFAAGAMIFVVVEELIPESQMHGNSDIATLGAILGFAVMMVLDVALG